MNEKNIIVLNSTILYISAFLTSTILHEFAHGLTGLFYNSEPVVHHNFVEHLSKNNLSVQQHLFIALSGPIFSLIQGLIAGWIFLKSKNRGLFQLFLLWFSVLGFNNFLGYLMTGPLFSSGDIGRAYMLMGSSGWIQIIAAILGAGALLFIAYKMTVPFLEFSYKKEWVADRISRKNFSLMIIILPWIIGSAIVTLLYLPIIAIISIIYPVMSGFVFVYPWQNAQRIENVEVSNNTEVGNLSIISVSVLVLLTLVFKFILAPGIHI